MLNAMPIYIVSFLDAMFVSTFVYNIIIANTKKTSCRFARERVNEYLGTFGLVQITRKIEKG